MDTATLEAPAKGIGRGCKLDVLTVARIKRMYLYENASYEEISIATGIQAKNLGNFVSLRGWPKLRKERERRLLNSHDARSENVDTGVIEAIVAQSEELTVRSLQKTGEALERNDRDAARDAQAYSATAKNLVGVARAIRDPCQLSSEAPRDFNLFLFVGQAGSQQAEKPVTEVEAKPVQ